MFSITFTSVEWLLIGAGWGVLAGSIIGLHIGFKRGLTWHLKLLDKLAEFVSKAEKNEDSKQGSRRVRIR